MGYMVPKYLSIQSMLSCTMHRLIYNTCLKSPISLSHSVSLSQLISLELRHGTGTVSSSLCRTVLHILMVLYVTIFHANNLHTTRDFNTQCDQQILNRNAQ